MIRLIQRKLIIPRGDTGSFSIPTIAAASQADVAVFTIFDCLTRTKAFQKTVVPQDSILTIEFTHNDTVNLAPGRYVWDIKFYKNPIYSDGELVNGEEIDSYYAGYSLPGCEIRETGDDYLISPDAPSGTLTPEQLDIISAALSDLATAVQQTETNVSHYPQIRDEEWYVWSAEANDYVATGVSANGIVGNGIESAVVNNDYTLTLNFTDGTSYTSGSIRGAVGNGIEDVVLNNDYTLTITFTDGTSYTTPSIRGMVGATPQFSIGTVQEGASAAVTITGTAEAPVLNLTLPNANVPTKVSELENDANYAVDANYVHTDNNYTTEEKTKLSGIAAGAEVNVNADWNATEGDAFIRNKPTSVSSFTNDAGYLTTETDPTVPAWAKAAQKPSYTAAEVGAPTVAEMQQAIANVNTMKIHICAQAEYDAETGVPTIQNPDTQTFYLVPGGEGNNLFIEWAYVNGAWEKFGSADVEVPVQDVQVNSVSVVGSDGVANIPKANATTLGVVLPHQNSFEYYQGALRPRVASTADIKTGTDSWHMTSAVNAPAMTYYGLSKAAGVDLANETVTLGTYPETSKTAIKEMLGVQDGLKVVRLI